MIDRLISSLLAFLIAIIPVNLNQANDTPSKQTTILFSGDVMLGRSVMGEALDKKDPYYPFRKTADFLSSADIAFINLENPIVKNCPRHVGGFKFCTNYEIANGLNFAGINVLTLANNHSGNYGKEGFEETKERLIQMGIDYVGDNNLVIKKVGGVKFGFLGFNYTFGFDNLTQDLALIAESDPAVDILIVSPHWGTEYQPTANSLQTAVAKRMVDSGADLIIGHHPHWVQNYEEYKGKPIYYSLGNFIFDQMWSEETKRGLIVKMTFEGKDLIKKEEFKTYMPKIGQPEIIRE